MTDEKKHAEDMRELQRITDHLVYKIAYVHIKDCTDTRDMWGTDWVFYQEEKRIEKGRWDEKRYQKGVRYLQKTSELREVIRLFSTKQKQHIRNYFIVPEYVLYDPEFGEPEPEPFIEWVIDLAPIFRVAQAVQNGHLPNDFTRLDLVQWGEGAGLELTEQGYNELRHMEQLGTRVERQQEASKKPAFNPQNKEERKTLEKARALKLSAWEDLCIRTHDPCENTGTVLGFKRISSEGNLVAGYVNKLNRKDENRTGAMDREDAGNAVWRLLHYLQTVAEPAGKHLWESYCPRVDKKEVSEDAIERKHDSNRTSISRLNAIFRDLFNMKTNPFRIKKDGDLTRVIITLGEFGEASTGDLLDGDYNRREYREDRQEDDVEDDIKDGVKKLFQKKNDRF